MKTLKSMYLSLAMATVLLAGCGGGAAVTDVQPAAPARPQINFFSGVVERDGKLLDFQLTPLADDVYTLTASGGNPDNVDKYARLVIAEKGMQRGFQYARIENTVNQDSSVTTTTPAEQKSNTFSTAHSVFGALGVDDDTLDSSFGLGMAMEKLTPTQGAKTDTTTTYKRVHLVRYFKANTPDAFDLAAVSRSIKEGEDWQMIGLRTTAAEAAQVEKARNQFAADLLGVKIAAATDAGRLDAADELFAEYDVLGVSMSPPLILQRAALHFQRGEYYATQKRVEEYISLAERGTPGYTRALKMLLAVEDKAAADVAGKAAFNAQESKRLQVAAARQAEDAKMTAKIEAEAEAEAQAAAAVAAASLSPKCDMSSKKWWKDDCWAPVSNRQHCFVSFPYSDKRTREISWSGQCEYGFASGHGILKHLDKRGRPRNAWQGTLVRGKPHGRWLHDTSVVKGLCWSEYRNGERVAYEDWDTSLSFFFLAPRCYSGKDGSLLQSDS